MELFWELIPFLVIRLETRADRQLLCQQLRQITCASLAALDDDVCRFPIKWVALRVKLSKFHPGIGSLQERAIFVLPRPSP